MTDGNVEVNLDEEAALEVGDAVCLKSKYFGKTHRDMGPRLLIDKVGWPNLFYVEKVGVSEEGQPAIVLSACCYNLETPKGDWRCKGHPASFFEKIRPEVEGEDRPRTRKPGDRTASVMTPLGEVASYEYQEDDENPGLILKILGRRFKANGLWLKQVLALAKEKGLA